ncbi:hypothetical protein [Natronorarus salvus]|uniref:hypothetical protein n=1 Tax=Natronorarus salvus TaxID=3117733 RepID=UPI002F26A514
MESLEHAAVGTVVSAFALALLRPVASPLRHVGLFVYGVALSVLVDLDHFLIARARTGDWSHLRAVLSDPVNGIYDQEWVFADMEGMARQRLASHLILGAVLVVGLRRRSPLLAAYTGVVLGAHVVCDLLRDTGRA